MCGGITNQTPKNASCVAASNKNKNKKKEVPLEGGFAGEGGGAAGGEVTRTASKNKKLRRQNRNQLMNLGPKKSPSQKRGHGDESGGSNKKERLKRHLAVLSKP